jgi:hypothetical protein
MTLEREYALPRTFFIPKPKDEKTISKIIKIEINLL